MTQTKDSTTGERERIARIIDPLVFDLADALNNAEGEPEQLRHDATAMRDERMKTALAKADQIIALSAPPVAGERVPAGWKLVPVEPTEAMMDAGLYQSSHDAKWEDVHSSWKDMLAAAPSPLAQPVAVPVSEEMVERGARAVDPEIWQHDAPAIPTRAQVEAFHHRRQQSARIARAALTAALSTKGA